MEGTHAESEREVEGRSHNWGRWLLVTAAVLVFYPLSAGPVVRLARERIISQSTIEFVYAPLIMLSDRWPPAERFFQWQRDLWEKKG